MLGQIPAAETRRGVLGEMSRVLRPTGLVVANVHNFRRWQGGSRETGLSLDDDEPYFKYYEPRELVGELPASLQPLRVFGLYSLGRKGEALGWVGLGLERLLESTAASRWLGSYLVLVARRKP